MQESDGRALELLLEELKIKEKNQQRILKELQALPAEEIMKALTPLAMVSMLENIYKNSHKPTFVVALK